MIKYNLKPTEKFIKFIEPTASIGKLRATICIYDEPVMIAGEVSIFTTLKIEEEIEQDFKPFNDIFYPNILTDEEVSFMFDMIKSNPEKFKQR